jgi:hypothetical protein
MLQASFALQKQNFLISERRSIHEPAVTPSESFKIRIGKLLLKFAAAEFPYPKYKAIR